MTSQQKAVANEKAGIDPKDQEVMGTDEKKLMIEEILISKNFAMVHNKMIPAIKEGIWGKAVEHLWLLRSTYLYSFENSLKFLTKSERVSL
ncbi:hypothetical protein PaeBR_11565 [Paenibacillus sp. BR2-3]|uniref:hypothetical protein n=1 Tax=Paenibacillus sp. BR2-3 TaxID=3048494 RepID=UPI003977B365